MVSYVAWNINHCNYPSFNSRANDEMGPRNYIAYNMPDLDLSRPCGQLDSWLTSMLIPSSVFFDTLPLFICISFLYFVFGLPLRPDKPKIFRGFYLNLATK